MRDTEWKLISELMKNSRRSDRELAKAIRVSQPTASRLIAKLEKEGKIQEYTMIPDFVKLGFNILAVTIVKLKQTLTSEEIDQAKKIMREALKVMPIQLVMLERGLGLNADGILISYHKDYASYVEFGQLLKRGAAEFLQTDEIRSFLIDLQDDVRFIPLTFSVVAQNLSRMKTQKE